MNDKNVITLFFLFLCLSHSLQAEEMADSSQVPSSLINPDSSTAEQTTANDIDWNRPMVSRGLGGRSVDGDADTALSDKQFQQGQVAYFNQNYGAAVALWKPLAEQGLADAQANIGWLYQAGLGMDKDVQTARIWYQKAAKQGHPVAQNNLGVMFENGISVTIDRARAKQFYRLSAEQGYRFAQYNLGNLLADDGIQIVEAQKWLTAAMNQGVTQAKERLEKLQSSL